MKARLWWTIRLVKSVASGFYANEEVPEGTVGVIIEAYNVPTEGYSVDVTLPDGRLDSVIVHPDDFVVLQERDFDIASDPTVPPTGTE